MNNIVILGCGVSGMLTALSLAKQDIKVTILEGSDLNFPQDQRNIAITAFSKSVFQKIGLWDALEPYMAHVKDIYVVDNKSRQMLHFSDNMVSADTIGYMIEYTHLREQLLIATKNNKMIDLKLSTSYELFEVSDSFCKLEVDKCEILTADILILCDGKKSKIRPAYFRDKVSKDYGQVAFSFAVEHEKPHEGTAVEHFTPKGPFAILPMCNPYHSSIIWTEPKLDANLYQNMSDDELLKQVEDRFGTFLGKIKILDKLQAFPLSARITANYFYKRIVLLADSAHIIHPLAGQGLNQGIKDIDTLSGIISKNLSVGLPIDQIALEEYENKRKLDNYLMYLATDNLNRLFSNNLPIISPLRKFGLSMLERFPKAKQWLLGYAAGNER